MLHQLRQERKQQEQRRFFRYDVSIPVYLKPLESVSSDGVQPKLGFISDIDLENLNQYTEQLNSELQVLFANEKYIQNGGVELFAGLNQKLEFMAWLFNVMAQGDNPRSEDAFSAKWIQTQKSKMPKSAGYESRFVAMLQAFHMRVDGIITELLSVVDNRDQTKVYFFNQPLQTNFSAEGYLNNLSSVAEQGNWLAQVSALMIAKLNRYEDGLREIKEATKVLSDSQNWPIEDVNLAGGGFAMHSALNIKMGDTVCVLFLLDNQYVMNEAKCVGVHKESPFDMDTKYAFQFESISADDQAVIVRFLTSKELENRAA